MYFCQQDIIFKQGDEGDNFYVISNGSVDVLVLARDQHTPTTLSNRAKSFKPKKDMQHNDGESLGRVVNRLNDG